MLASRTTLYDGISEFFLCTSDQAPALAVRHSCLCTGVSYRTKCIDLTQKEFDLVELLMRNPGKVYSREQLLDLVWGYDYQGDIRTVDVHIRRLREKLERNPAAPEYSITKWGVGYYFAEA